MDDLISRKALLAKYDRVHIGEPGNARKLIEDAPAVQQWISVKDRLPENNQDVLAYMQNSIESRIFPACYHKNWWEDCIWNTRCLSVTHWMPLTNPPKGE